MFSVVCVGECVCACVCVVHYKLSIANLLFLRSILDKHLHITSVRRTTVEWLCVGVCERERERE